MKVLLDCNVLMDVVAGRAPHFPASQAVLDWCEQNSGSGFVALHSIATLSYLMEKAGKDEEALAFFKDYLVFGEVAPSGTAEVKHALSLHIPDFEDALQATAAVLIGADYVITRNKKDFRNSPIPAISPAEFVALPPP